jgi:hypothetical protein
LLLTASFAADAPTFVDIKDTAYAIPTVSAYFVAPDGSASGTGTLDSPWTVQKALSATGAPAGSTVVFRGGTYRGVANVSVNRPLTLQAYPHEKPWLTGSIVISDWVQDGNAWRKDGWAYAFPQTVGPQWIDPAYPLAGQRDQAFFDGRSLVLVGSRAAVGPGKFYVDYNAQQLFIGDNPAGHTVEGTAYTLALTVSRSGSSDPTGAVVRGLGFTDYADQGATLAAPQVLFENNTCAWNGQQGLGIFGGDTFQNTDMVVRGNVFVGNGRKGRGAGNNERLLVEDNTFAYNNVNGYATGWDAAGIKFGRQRDLTFRNNLLDHNYASGFWVDVSCINTTVVGNVARHNQANGFDIEISHTAIVAFNLLYQNATGILVLGSSNVRAYNNTLATNGTDLVSKDAGRINDPNHVPPIPGTNAEDLALGATWISHDDVFVNNILSNNRPGSTNPLFNANSPRTGMDSTSLVAAADYNFYYRSNGSQPANLLSWNFGNGQLANYAHLTEVRAAFGGYYETNGREIDGGANPFFVNEETNDYRLTATSQALGHAAVLPDDIAAAAGVPVNIGYRGALGTASAAAPPLGSNLLTSPGFEEGLGNWVVSGGAQVVTGNAHSGTHALSLPRYGAYAAQLVSGLTPGGTYAYRGYAKVAAGGAVAIGAGDDTVSVQSVVTSTAYVAVSGVFTLGPGSTSASVWVWNGGSPAAWADDLELYHLPDPPPASLSAGGFETPSVGTGLSAYQYNPSGSPWTFDSDSGVAGNGSLFTAGNPNAPEGSQVAFLQSYGSISQTVTFAAGTYNISFLAAQRGNSQASSQTFEVLVDGAVVGTFTPASTTYAAYSTGSFTVAAGAHTIAFVGLDPDGQDNTAFLDQVLINVAS